MLGMNEFAHLHVHSEYSLLDGLSRITPLVQAAKGAGMTSLALTDHGAMFGAMEYYKTAQDNGVKPIVGMETYVAPRAMTLREGKQDASGYHLVLQAENEVGYRNLLKLASEAQLRGFYYKPRIDRELLAQHAEGLICLSACLSSEMGRSLVRRDLDEAERVARWHAELFPGRYYLEIQDHGLADQRLMTEGIIAISRKLGLPLVATNDVHYIAQANSYAHEVLLCVQTGVTMDDPKRMRMDSNQFYLKPPSEMATLFSNYPEAISNTLAIAERCNLTLAFDRVQLPSVRVPDGHTVETYLAHLCREGLPGRYEEVTPALRERLEYELGVIVATGFAAYFLLLEDLVTYARNHGISVGPGRGSAAGSLVAYVLGITDIDPLRHDLLFERFLNPERKSMPDIDTDFADDRRDEVIKYIVERYGADHVAQIGTFGSMAARAAIKDVGRALGMPYGDVEAVAKLIPQKPGQKFTIKGCLETIRELKEMYDGRDDVHKLLDTAQQLEDVKRHSSTHAAGVVISAEPLVNYVPLARPSKDEEGIPATQFEYRIIDRIGLLKMDILGLTTLTLIRRAVDLIERTRGHVIDPREIEVEDPAIYELLCTGETTGVFQLESGGMKKLLKDMQPSRFADVVALIALYRPGPMAFIDEYNARKHGKAPITYPDPRLEPILKDTHGIIVYQEQVLLIARELAGFSWGQADALRKAIGKKLPEEMKKQKQVFLEGCKANGTSLKVAPEIWDIIEVFAQYAFCKAHAAAYAVLTAQAAFIKRNYRVEYMAACLSMEQGNPDRSAVILSECRRMGVRILLPDINRSELDFSVDDGAVLYALSAVRNVGVSAIRGLLEERERNGPFSTVEDFCNRADWKALNKRALEGLIKSGALDCLAPRPDTAGQPNALEARATLWANLDRLCTHGQRSRRAADLGQVSLFATAEVESPGLALLPAQDISRKQVLRWEKEMLGLYLSEHPLFTLSNAAAARDALPLSAITEEYKERKVTVVVMVSSMRQIYTRKNETMLSLELEDLDRTMEAVVFPRTYARTKDLWAEDAILLVTATVDIRDDRPQLICEDASPFENKISDGLSHLTIHFQRSGDTDRDLARLRRLYVLAQEFVGSDTVEFTTDVGGRRHPIPVPQALTTCCCPELLERLAEVVGRPCIEVRKVERPPAPTLEPSPARALVSAAS